MKWYTPTLMHPTVSDNYCFFIQYAVATLQDIDGTPVHAMAGNATAWIRIQGLIECRHVRFGGESSVCVLHVVSRDLNENPTAVQSIVNFDDCAIYSGQQYWARIF